MSLGGGFRIYARYQAFVRCISDVLLGILDLLAHDSGFLYVLISSTNSGRIVCSFSCSFKLYYTATMSLLPACNHLKCSISIWVGVLWSLDHRHSPGSLCFLCFTSPNCSRAGNLTALPIIPVKYIDLAARLRCIPSQSLCPQSRSPTMSISARESDRAHISASVVPLLLDSGR